jgi:hypothetical protein
VHQPASVRLFWSRRMRLEKKEEARSDRISCCQSFEVNERICNGNARTFVGRALHESESTRYFVIDMHLDDAQMTNPLCFLHFHRSVSFSILLITQHDGLPFSFEKN